MDANDKSYAPELVVREFPELAGPLREYLSARYGGRKATSYLRALGLLGTSEPSTAAQFHEMLG